MPPLPSTRVLQRVCSSRSASTHPHPPPPASARRAEVLGIHGDPLRAIPLFTAYLAVLFHTYSLAARIAQAGSPGAGAGAVTTAAAAPPADLEAGAAQRRPARGASDAALSQQAYLGEALGSRLSSSLQLVGLRLLEACYSSKRWQGWWQGGHAGRVGPSSARPVEQGGLGIPC